MNLPPIGPANRTGRSGNGRGREVRSGRPLGSTASLPGLVGRRTGLLREGARALNLAVRAILQRYPASKRMQGALRCCSIVFLDSELPPKQDGNSLKVTLRETTIQLAQHSTLDQRSGRPLHDSPLCASLAAKASLLAFLKAILQQAYSRGHIPEWCRVTQAGHSDVAHCLTRSP